MFDTIQENDKPLAELVVDRIVQMIADKSLQAGEKLPNEFELAEQLSVGRGTVRESVKLLISRNILEIRRGKGTFVSHKPGISNDPLGMDFIKDKRKLALDLVELRLIIEPKLANLAASTATADDVAQMKELCKTIEEKIELGENYREWDQELHTCIARSTRNQVVPNLIPIITITIEIFIQLTNRALRQETISSHRAIVEAIEQHDAVRARDAMITHLLSSKNTISSLPAELFKRMGGEPY